MAVILLWVSQVYNLFIFLLRLATKVGIAGGAVYVAYDSGLLSGSAEGSEALNKAKAAIPPAVHEWSKYFGLEVKCPRNDQSCQLVASQFNCA